MYQRIVRSGIPAIELGEHLSSNKESEYFGHRVQILLEPPLPRSIDIMGE